MLVDQQRCKIIIMCQNAWSPFYAGEEWPRDLWLAAFHRCRSGKRLQIISNMLESSGFDIWFDNTTRIVGDNPDSFVPPDHDHIRRLIVVHKPLLIVTCGVSALKSVRRLYDGNIVAVPHPASRVLRNELYIKAGQMILDGVDKSIKLEWDRKRNRTVIKKL